MKRFVIQVRQFVEELAEITVEAETGEKARKVVEDSIWRGMLDDEYDLDWHEGTGSHHDGIVIDAIKEIP